MTFKLSMDISPQNSYFNYFTTTKIKKYQEGEEEET
jgi:hypothetical protein